MSLTRTPLSYKNTFNKRGKMKANIEVENIKGELEVESQEAQDFLNYMIPEFFKDGVGIINDLVKSWRWKNQINILQKSKKFLEEKKLESSEIPLKILIPLLEKSSLEEDDTLQNKWAKLLAYASYSKEFEYTKSFINILEQITVLEAKILSWMHQEIKSQTNKNFRIDDVSKKMEIDKEKILIIYDNFLRLGLLTQESRGQGINIGSTISVVQNIRPNGNFKITNFGKAFLNVCEEE
jgi:hypothetical protein